MANPTLEAEWLPALCHILPPRCLGVPSTFQVTERCHDHLVQDSQLMDSTSDLGVDQYLLIPFLGEWTSIYQLFWCSPGVQGFDTLPFGWFFFGFLLKPVGTQTHIFLARGLGPVLETLPLKDKTATLESGNGSVRTFLNGLPLSPSSNGLSIPDANHGAGMFTYKTWWYSRQMLINASTKDQKKYLEDHPIWWWK